MKCERDQSENITQEAGDQRASAWLKVIEIET